MTVSKISDWGTWVLITLTALAFIAAGGAKVAGVEMVHQSFANMGLPGWTGYLVGVLELAGAIGLFVRRLSAQAAAGLAVIMAGAAGYHLVFDPLSAAIPAFMLLAMNLAIFRLRKPDMIGSQATRV